MKIYIANFVDIATLEAEMDDPSFDMTLMASPQFYEAFPTLDDAKLTELKNAAEEEAAYGDEGRPGAWRLVEHNQDTKDGRREVWVYVFSLDEDQEGEPWAITLVIQAVELGQ